MYGIVVYKPLTGSALKRLRVKICSPHAYNNKCCISIYVYKSICIHICVYIYIQQQ